MKYSLLVRYDKFSPYVYNSNYWSDDTKPLPEIGTVIPTPQGRAMLTDIHVDGNMTTGYATVITLTGADTMKRFTAR
jgi:hypothetical protein